MATISPERQVPQHEVAADREISKLQQAEQLQHEAHEHGEHICSGANCECKGRPDSVAEALNGMFAEEVNEVIKESPEKATEQREVSIETSAQLDISNGERETILKRQMHEAEENLRALSSAETSIKTINVHDDSALDPVNYPEESVAPAANLAFDISKPGQVDNPDAEASVISPQDPTTTEGAKINYPHPLPFDPEISMPDIIASEPATADIQPENPEPVILNQQIIPTINPEDLKTVLKTHEADDGQPFVQDFILPRPDTEPLQPFYTETNYPDILAPYTANEVNGPDPTNNPSGGEIQTTHLPEIKDHAAIELDQLVQLPTTETLDSRTLVDEISTNTQPEGLDVPKSETASVTDTKQILETLAENLSGELTLEESTAILDETMEGFLLASGADKPNQDRIKEVYASLKSNEQKLQFIKSISTINFESLVLSGDVLSRYYDEITYGQSNQGAQQTQNSRVLKAAYWLINLLSASKGNTLAEIA